MDALTDRDEIETLIEEIRDDIEEADNDLASAESCETVKDFVANLEEARDHLRTVLGRTVTALTAAKKLKEGD
jgi:hypothetical protein